MIGAQGSAGSLRCEKLFGAQSIIEGQKFSCSQLAPGLAPPVAGGRADFEDEPGRKRGFQFGREMEARREQFVIELAWVNRDSFPDEFLLLPVHPPFEPAAHGCIPAQPPNWEGIEQF